MKIGFLGSGKMAEAILSGVLQSELAAADDITACDKSEERLALMRNQFGVKATADAAEMIKKSEVVIIAVKPQDTELLLSSLTSLFTHDHLIISIAAGKKLEFLRRVCGSDSRLVRVMPNLALMAQEGMSVFCMADGCTEEDRDITAQIFGSAGAVLELPENCFDAVTALSGSGPAFIAYFLKGLIDGAVRLGLEESAARLLAEQTMIGTAVYLQESGRDIKAFIEAVCSPGGTTEAGMNVLSASDAFSVLEKTLAAAAARSRGLGS
ncbi:MAG: pyrroline-5-carboxylate reductase [Kiritimatiellia bacterium]